MILRFIALSLLSLLFGCGGGSDRENFTIGGSIKGLASGEKIVLLNNNNDSLTLDADGRFEFRKPVDSNGSYSVTVGTQPRGKICTVNNGTGTSVVASVNSVTVTCSAVSYRVSGTVAGLADGQQVTLKNNDTDPLIVSANGHFTFSMPVAYNGNYVVTVGGQPTGQTCTVRNGSGVAMADNVDSVSVVCSINTFRVAGTVRGLTVGQQVTLRNNNADPLTVVGNGSFTFATPVAYNGGYAVSVATQPAGQTCTVSNSTGQGIVADVDSVVVTCSTSAYTVGGTVSGLASDEQVILNNGGIPLIISANGSFAFPERIVYGGSYSVVVLGSPPNKTCTVNNGNGVGIMADVNSVTVICSPTAYSIGGNVTGLAINQQLILNNNSDLLTISVNGSFTFATPVPFNGSYSVTVTTQPNGQFCSVFNGSGTGVIESITSIQINCSQVGGSYLGES